MSLLGQHADKWEPEPMSGCYIWTGALRRRSDSRHNFPTITVKGRNANLPALVLTEKAGERPSGHQVSHVCGNWCCVNPEHLRWETGTQNNSRKSKENRRFLKTTKGYYYNKPIKRWVAQYTVKDVWKYAGCFKTAEEARAAYLAAIDKEA